MSNPKFTNKTLYQWMLEQIAQHTDDSCLIWPYSTIKHGYGTVFVPDTKTVVLVHRLAFKITHGRWPMPKGLHRCDNPPCFNPRHIFEGTQIDNIADMVAKGRARAPIGTEQWCARFTDDDIREIRRLYSSGITQVQIAKDYGTYQPNISAIVLGKAWKHVK